jgi:hypothetical protein
VADLPDNPRPYVAPYGATARRPSWPSLPASLRALVEERLGQPVTDSHPGRRVHERLRQPLAAG